MDAKLLQKIEELTLYAIAQEKKMNTYKKKNRQWEVLLSQQQRVLKALENRIQELEEK